jgi:hypothetical protein
MAHQIFWDKAKAYPRAYANRVLADAGGFPPLPAIPDKNGKVPDTVTWEEIQAHAKTLKIVVAHIA